MSDDLRSDSGDDSERRCAKNLCWQKIFNKQIAPICLFVNEERDKCQQDDVQFFRKFAPGDATKKSVIEVAGESVVITVVKDARKPPADLEYNQITLALEDPDASYFKNDLDGVYLVREISPFSVAPNKPCVTERLFMDRKRENYKSKGWGIGRWRVWLALDDVDAARKKRKKAEIASMSAKPKKHEPATPPGESLKRSLQMEIDVNDASNNKRRKELAAASSAQLPYMVQAPLLRSLPMASTLPGLPRGVIDPSIFQQLSQQSFFSAVPGQQQQPQMIILNKPQPIFNGIPQHMQMGTQLQMPMNNAQPTQQLAWMSPSTLAQPRLMTSNLGAQQMLPWASSTMPFILPSRPM